MLDDAALLERVRGGVFGQALGDAFCTPALETPERTRARFGRITTFLAPPADHPVHAGLRAGQFTDDTEQALYLARAIVEHEGALNAEIAARAIMAWYDAVDGDHCAFIGPSTRRAVQRMRAGEPLSQTGLGGDTNGAAMRASVVGLIHPSDVEAAAREAALSALPTHNTRQACAAAAAVAGAVAQALAPEADLSHVVQAAIESARIGEQYGAAWFGASVPHRIALAVRLVAEQAASGEAAQLQALADVVGNSMLASESVPAAFGIVVLAGGEPYHAAVLAAALSGDADTIGAIACAICGALRGFTAIPSALAEQLRRANPTYDLDATAHALFAIARRRFRS
ncbi:MAG: ADP-ribosylglycohydrolase family protein [Thermoflexales bacterium]|nr:ADP-ribosylglycohydrolase family protein [Thermoflexales bacterium]